MKHHEIGRLVARIAVTGALTAGVATAAMAGTAYAGGTTTRYVGASAGSDKSCASPGYATVQAAVNAANPGDTVYLCGTNPYKGQVIITKSITLTGASGATIAAPSTWAPSADSLPSQFASDNLLKPQAPVVAWGQGVHVTISGLTVNGPLPGNGGCAEEEFGILVIDGASAVISHDAVTNIADANTSLYGCQFGIGIGIGHENWPNAADTSTLVENFTGTATITHTTVSGYQKDGIDVDGPGSSAKISDNTVAATGPNSPFGRIIAPNGIEIARGAAAQIQGNTVSGNQYTGSAATGGSGILLFGGCGDPLVKDVTVTGNKVINNDVGIYLGNFDSTCTMSTSTKTGNVVTLNQVSDSAVTNTNGYSTGCAYQAGIQDQGGNHDVIDFNHISGRGYADHPTCSTAQPYVTLPIDTTGAIDPILYLNL